MYKIDLLRLCGLSPDGVDGAGPVPVFRFGDRAGWTENGTPIYSLTKEETAIVDLISSLPDTEDDFLLVNLSQSILSDAVSKSITADMLTAIQTDQCNRIRKLRADAYATEADPLFFASEADGDSRETWLNKRKEIKERYPWPGEYR